MAEAGFEEQFDASRDRVAAHYRRGRHRARARQDAYAAGKEGTRQFLYHDVGEGGGFASSRPLGNMADCPDDNPTTVLGQAYLADCEAGNPDMPLGGDGDTHQHLSDLERRHLAVAMEIAAANADAARLALRVQNLLDADDQFQAAQADLLRRRTENLERLRYFTGDLPGCPTYAYYRRCVQGLPVGDPDAFLAAANALGG